MPSPVPAPSPGHITEAIPRLPGAALRVDYRREPLDALLREPRLLAVFGFGGAAPATHADPRYLHVALDALGDAPLECWLAEDEVRAGRSDGVAWAQGDALQFGAIEVVDDGDIETAAEQAYARLHAWLAQGEHPHLLRLWNYMDGITEGEGDAERYRRFCVGRARGIAQAIGRDPEPGELPAATAIGHPRRSGRFQLYWLAARRPGVPLENPRQTAAWRYPRQYGPQPPGFARAMLPPAGAAMPLLLSGTAAVVGHASQHGELLEAQLDETLVNIDSLLAAAHARRASLPARLGTAARLKVYVRDADALPRVAALLQSRLPAALPRIVLHGHVCRRELAVEIDGVHG